MTRIGMREFRQKTGDYVRRAAKGEMIEITNRGRPVAQLTMLPTRDDVRHRSTAEEELDGRPPR